MASHEASCSNLALVGLLAVGARAGRGARCRARWRRRRGGLWEVSRAPTGHDADAASASPTRRARPMRASQRPAARGWSSPTSGDRDGDPLHLRRRRLRPVEDDRAHAAHRCASRPRASPTMLPFNYVLHARRVGDCAGSIKAAFNHSAARAGSCRFLARFPPYRALNARHLGRSGHGRPYLFGRAQAH